MSEIYEWLQALCGAVPGGIGRRLRAWMLPGFFAACGRHFYCGVRCRFQNPKAITLGDHVALNDGVWIAANPARGGSIRIGNHVLIGPHCVIHSANH